MPYGSKSEAHTLVLNSFTTYSCCLMVERCDYGIQKHMPYRVDPRFEGNLGVRYTQTQFASVLGTVRNKK